MTETQSKYSLALQSLFKDARERIYPKNQLIQYQGDPMSHVYVIEKGYVKAYTILDSGDTRTMLILGPGDIFPLAFSASLDWENYQIRYFYQSLSEAKLHVLPSEVMKRSIEQDSKLMNTYMTYLAASNEAIMTQLEVMKNKKAIDKVGLLLPYLVSKAGKLIKPGIHQLNIRLSHQEIADLSGVTRETTTTLIKQLEKQGVIDQKQGKWLINLQKLEN